MSEVKYYVVTEEDAGQRLDNFLLKYLKGVPKSYIYRIIRRGEVRINKHRVKPLDKLQLNDSIRIPPTRTSETPTPQFVGDKLKAKLSTCILFEDNRLIVLNKPVGMAVHGGSGVSLGVIEALRLMRPEAKFLELVHRIDKDTSGCLLVAKKRSVLKDLHAQLIERKIKKIYWALVTPHWTVNEIRKIDVSLEKYTLSNGERMVKVSPQGKPSITLVRCIKNYKHASLVEAEPLTGRTHQIRVHLGYVGHPIVGDEKYRGQPVLGCCPVRMYLHAREIHFNLGDEAFHFKADDLMFEQAILQLSQE